MCIWPSVQVPTSISVAVIYPPILSMHRIIVASPVNPQTAAIYLET
jgi:hypothetical protein